MMIVQGEKMSVPSSLELVQHLYDKNVELEKKCRRSAQARVPSDPNTWQQMRENYETIILSNHEFSEKHNIEYALWQLHYRRIEDFRAHLSAASASMGSATSHTGKGGLTQTNRVTKIRLQFKAFLSEATGFYHDLILKIRAKTGLPIGHFPEDSDNLIDMEKDGKRSGELKKGLISCNRCLIYLGDLARYKGLYGEGESKSGDYAAASSYYLQAASLWPSSGNPHHQLAILATYSGDELLAVYHYFRSLAVDNPFSTAKDNLIVVFEKNRKSYSRLHGGAKGLAIKESPEPTNTRGRGKAGATVDYNSATEKGKKIHEAYKAFSICFVQLNGILFTHTSLETFGGVLSLVRSALHELLSSGPEEELNFGTDAVDNGRLILRLTSILIFTVHNMKREAEGQSYADLLQRRVLLQNALTVAFDLMGHIVKRCLQLSDPSSSYLLPSILVYVEWLASCPDLAAGGDIDDKQAHIISNFWNHCVSFLNKLLCGGLVSIEDEDEVCFSNMGKYKEGETENRLALKEDLELRGFLPLQPAQSILDFSRRHSFAGDKEKKARVERILAAGKALANAVKVDKKPLRFDPKLKKFVIGNAPQKSDATIPIPQLDSPKTSGGIRENLADSTTKAIVQQQKAQPCFESEEEDEVIIFKPTVFERRTDDSLVSDPRSNIIHQPSSLTNLVPQHLQLYESNPTMWLVDSQASLGNGFKNLILSENGHVMKPLMQEDIRISQTASLSCTTEQPLNATGISYGQSKSSGATIQPKIDRSSAFTNAVSLGVNPVTCSSKGPPNRPVRRLGPPPGFSSARPKQVTEGNFGSLDLKGENPLINNNSWLNAPLHSNPQYIGNFPGKQALQSLYTNPEQVEQQQYITLPKQHQGQSTWTGRHPV